MIVRLFKTALVAGLIAGAFGWAVQMALTTPLIIAAEAYENAPPMLDHAHDGDVAEDHSHDDSAWAPEDGFERYAVTLVTSVLLGAGFGAILAACFLMANQDRVGWRRGLVWGLLGYVAVFAAPALGLPPELPGMSAAGVAERQVWWVATVAATAIGLFAMIRGANWPVRLVGVGLIIVPHVVGAPHPDAFSAGPPAELAAQFAVASLIGVALFWMMLGAVAGWAWERFGDA